MNKFFPYLMELNICLMILFVAYKLFFEKDKNFTVRRIYLFGVIILPFLLPLLPGSIRMPVGQMSPISINLEGVTIFGTGAATAKTGSLSFTGVLMIIYLVFLALGIVKMLLQLVRIARAIIHSKRFEAYGNSLIASPTLPLQKTPPSITSWNMKTFIKENGTPSTVFSWRYLF